MHVARVSLRVSDPERSADFYGRVAGLAPRAQANGALTLGAPDGGPVLLELRRAERPGRVPRAAAGLYHTALRYPTRAALAAALRRTLDLGVLTGASDHAVSEALYLDDPDGLGVELYRDRPREQWAPPGHPRFLVTEPLDMDGLLAAADGELPEAAAGVDVGHVHLKVADVGQAIDYWTKAIGLDLMAQLGDLAAFLADGGYHHHIGANSWESRGAPLEPQDGPGLDAVVLAVDDLTRARERLRSAGAAVEERDAAVETRTPDGVRVVLEPA